jgi:hypothetical protein
MNNSQATTEAAQGRETARATHRLVFPHGVANLTIGVDASITETYRAEFYGPKPNVSERDGVVSIDYPRFNPLIWGRTAADIRLNPAVGWAIDIRDGVSRWNADLREVELRGIDVRGGVSHLDLQLPRPTGEVRIHVSGGASQVTLRRPAGVAARLQVAGGASKLALDDQFFGAVGGPVRLEAPDHAATAERYVVEIGGGASKITVGRQ